MKSKPFLLMMGLLITAGVTYPQQKILSQMDGTDWIGVTDSYRLGFIAGVIVQSGASSFELHTQLNLYVKPVPVAGETSERKAWRDWLKIICQSALDKVDNLSLFGITVGQISDGVNAFYSDFTNRRIKILDTIYVVKMQVQGQDPELIQAQIRYLRMRPDFSGEVFNNLLKKIVELRQANEKAGVGFKVTRRDIADGKVTEDEMLKCGIFIDKAGEEYDLFCYGNYK